MTDVVDYAIALTRRGYYVYPVNVRLEFNERKQKNEKKPFFKSPGWQKGEYPTDPDAIREHWKGFDGIAINTERSGVVLVDIDLHGEKNGYEGLKEVGVELPPTPVVVNTPTGGEHRLYRAPEGIPVHSDNSGKLAVGVDIRAIGGLGFAPPTIVKGLGSYEFADPTAMVPAAHLPEFPRDIAEALKPRKTEIATSDERPTLTFEQRARMQAKIDRILRDLTNMGDGERNATMRLRMIRLFGIALTLGEDPEAVAQLARDAYFESGGTAEHELEHFLDWARKHARYELPEDETDEAFEAEVASIMRRAKVQEEAKLRLSPIRVQSISDDDILDFDPEALAGDWWIDGLLPKSETVILFGTPNAGKSFAGIDVAMGVALGTEAWGQKVLDSSNVLYLAGEGTRRLSLRRRAWEVFHERAPDKKQAQFRKMRLMLGSDESVAQHRDLIKKGGFGLIVVDTMMRASEGLVLENPGEAARTIAQFDRIREDNPEATVLVLHHPAKSDPENPAGSYPIKGNVDTILKLANEEGYRYLSITKSKESDTSWTGTFELKDIRIPGTNLSSAVFVRSGWVAPPDENPFS